MPLKNLTEQQQIIDSKESLIKRIASMIKSAESHPYSERAPWTLQDNLKDCNDLLKEAETFIQTAKDIIKPDDKFESQLEFAEVSSKVCALSQQLYDLHFQLLATLNETEHTIFKPGIFALRGNSPVTTATRYSPVANGSN
ncbi:MAG: hypothetical protein KBD83_04370 [Gammaproteobacteria bacterium]|nr:hypothetical protein [Gammaproteobacteria bacterium]